MLEVHVEESISEGGDSFNHSQKLKILVGVCYSSAAEMKDVKHCRVILTNSSCV